MAKTRTSPEPNDVTKSLQLLMQFIAELKLEVAAIRVVMRASGVTQEEIDVATAELRKKWNAETEPWLRRIAETERHSALLRTLDEQKGPKQ